MKLKNQVQYSEFYSYLNSILEDSQVHRAPPTTSREFMFGTLPLLYHFLLNLNTLIMEMHLSAMIEDP